MRVWTAIKDYEGLYEVSSDGSVRSVTLIGGNHDGKTLSQSAAFTEEDGFATFHLAYLLREMAAQLEHVR